MKPLMKPLQGATLSLALLVLSISGLPAAAAGEPVDKQATEKAIERAEKAATYCPKVTLRFGAIVIQSGRCYTLYLFRDTRGFFLAFSNPGARIPPGQFVRLSTPAGAKVKGRIFYLVPIQGRGLNLPVNSVLLTTVRVQEAGPRLVIILGSGGSTVSVTFERKP